MGIVSIMAAILEEELRERGIFELTQLECETMVRSMVERTAELEADVKRYQLERSSRDST
ncbi:hypothetical protein [Bradyrhizobium sp.]|uniref:hypothetical protein n=1 Tax=Bradyrhizobium sp. TaxID=376 RepID=UPI003C3D686F